MKLGIQTNSLVNHIYSRATVGQPAPTVGMGATFLGWTDRTACTITKVTELTGSKVWQWEIEATADKTTVVAGSSHDGSAEYAYAPGTGSPSLFRFNKKAGAWVAVFINRNTGRLCKYNGAGLRIGERDHYRDPSF